MSRDGYTIPIHLAFQVGGDTLSLQGHIGLKVRPLSGSFKAWTLLPWKPLTWNTNSGG